jgi:hypothetical protein
MDRNLLGSFVGELLGLSLLGALGFVYGGTAALEPGKADGGWLEDAKKTDIYRRLASEEFKVSTPPATK